MNDPIIWALAKNDVFMLDKARNLLVLDALIAIEKMLDVKPPEEY